MLNRVYLMNYMEFMKDKPDKYYDLAIVDPPYGIGDFMQAKGKAIASKDKYKKINWNDNIPEKKYFDYLFRIAKNHIIFGCQYYAKYLRTIDCGRIIHIKKVPMSTLSQADIASCSMQKKVSVFEYKWHGMLQENMKHKEYRIHPCQKPVALYKWLLQNYAKPGQTIFDSHVGSGSIRIACHDLGFDFEGTELDPDYWQAQEKRFQNHIAQSELFDKSEIQDLVFKEDL